MPSITIDVRCRYEAAQAQALMQAAHDALVEALGVSPVHRNVLLREHAASHFIGRTDCPDPARLTNLTIHLLPGRSVEAKRRLYRSLVQRFEAFGIPPACVLVRLVEQPAENFGVRGGQALCDVELGYPLSV